MAAAEAEFTPDAELLGRLRPQLEDARLLLTFVSRERPGALSAEDLRAVLEAERRLSEGRWSVETETRFWVAYNGLAAKASPATVETIQDAWGPAELEGDAGAPPPAAGVQERGAEEREAEERGAQDGGNPLQRWLARLRARSGRRRVPVARAVRRYLRRAFISLVLVILAQGYWGIGFQVVQDVADTDARVEAVKEQIGRATDAELGKLTAQLDGLSARYEAHLAVLRVTTLGIPEQHPNASPVEKVKEALLLRDAQAFVNDIILKYLLPVLLGWLGACVFVLRWVLDEVRQTSFSASSDMGYRTRMYLGAIAGLVTAWFMSPESSGSTLASISPLALSFLAGYGVELLFTAMDRIIQTFTERKPQATSLPAGAVQGGAVQGGSAQAAAAADQS